MKRNKKGFTMVELVVVIAVIAILVSVAIPIFVNLINRANTSKDISTVQNLNTALSVDEPLNGPAGSLGEAVAVLKENGYDFENITPLKTGEIIYDAAHNRFSLLDGGNLIYKGHEDTQFDKNAVNIHIWRVCDSWSKINQMNSSVYLSRKISATDRAKPLTFTQLAGIDSGENPYTGTLTLKNEGEANIEVRGTFGRVEVDLPYGILSHYGYAQYMYIIHLMENGLGGYVNVELPDGTLSYENKEQHGYILDLQQYGYYEFGTVSGIEWEKLHDGAWVTITEPHLEKDIENVANSSYGSRYRICSIHNGAREEELYFANAFVNGDFAHTLTNVSPAAAYDDYVISGAVHGVDTLSDDLGSWFGWCADVYGSANEADKQYNYYAGDGTSALIFRSEEQSVNAQLNTRIVLFEGFTYNLSFMYMYEGVHKPSTSSATVLVTSELGDISVIRSGAAYDFQNNSDGQEMFRSDVKDKGWTKATCTFTVPNTSDDPNEHKAVSYYLYVHLYSFQAKLLVFDEFTCYPTVQTVENEKAKTYFTHTHASQFTIPDVCLLYEDKLSGNWYGKYVATDPVLNSIITYTLDGAESFNLEFDTEGDYDVTTTFSFAGRTYSETKRVKVRKGGMPATLVFKDENGTEIFRNNSYRVGETLRLDYVVEKENYRQNGWRDDKGTVVSVGSDYYVADTFVVFTPKSYTATLCGELLIDPYKASNWTGWKNAEGIVNFDEAQKAINITPNFDDPLANSEEYVCYAVHLMAGVQYTFKATVNIKNMQIGSIGGSYFAVMVKEDRTNSIDYPVMPTSNFLRYGPNTTISNHTESINATWTCLEDGIYYVSILSWSVDHANIAITDLSLRSSAGHAYTGAYDAHCNFCDYVRPVNYTTITGDVNFFSDGTITSFNSSNWHATKPSVTGSSYDLSTKVTYDSGVSHTADGSGSMKVQYASAGNRMDSYMVRQIQLQPGYQYEIKFSYKTSADYATIGGSFHGNVYLVDIDADAYTDRWVDTGDNAWRISAQDMSKTTEWRTWQRIISLGGDSVRNLGVGIVSYGLTAGTLWIDDIVIRRLSPAENQIGYIGSFDTEYYQDIFVTEDMPSGSTQARRGWMGLTGWRYRNQTTKSTENSIPGDTSTGSLKFVSKGYPSNFRYEFILQPGDYTISVRYKYKDLKTVRGDAFIGLVYADRMVPGDHPEPTWVENFESSGLKIKSFNNGGDNPPITQENWESATLSFTVDYTQTMYFVFKSNGCQEGSTIWLDELEVYRQMDENVIVNGNFAYGDTDVALKDSQQMKDEGWIGGWNHDNIVSYTTAKSYDRATKTGSLKLDMVGAKTDAGDYKGNVKKIFNVTGGLKYELTFMLWTENVTTKENSASQTAKIKIGKWNVAQSAHNGNWTDNSTSLARGTLTSNDCVNTMYCSLPLLNPAGFTLDSTGSHKGTNAAACAQTWNTYGWKKYTFTFDASKTEPYYFGIMWNGLLSGTIYIDDIQLRAVGQATDMNLVDNYKFLGPVYGAGSPSSGGVAIPSNDTLIKKNPSVWLGWTAKEHTFETSTSYTADGSGSLLLKNPSTNKINNGNLWIATGVYLQQGMEYTVSFKIKIVNGSNPGSGVGWIRLRNSIDVDHTAPQEIGLVSNLAVTTNWVTVSTTFTAKYSEQYFLTLKAYGLFFDEMYIDEIIIAPNYH